MDYKKDCTKGEAEISECRIADNGSYFFISIKREQRAGIVPIKVSQIDQTSDEAEANAKLITETFNVLNTTGYTPLELVEQVRTLREATLRMKECVTTSVNYGEFKQSIIAVEAALSSTEPIK